MNNFIIFFHGKEGTSPLVRILNNFKQLSVVHQVSNRGFEPFDRGGCGSLSNRNLKRCLELVFGSGPVDMERLNRIYTKTAESPLDGIDKSRAVGFKMRFAPPGRGSLAAGKLPVVGGYSLEAGKLPMVGGYLNRRWKAHQRAQFNELMFDLLKERRIVTFFAVRQDVFRKALSIYRGDGFGRSGHLQFKIAEGQIRKEDLPKIRIDCDRLETLIASCERRIEKTREHMEKLERLGVRTYPLLYEMFCEDKQRYFREFYEHLEIPISEEEIRDVLAKGAYFKKVHSHDISEFVENHHEVMERFGDRFVSWS